MSGFSLDGQADGIVVEVLYWRQVRQLDMSWQHSTRRSRSQSWEREAHGWTEHSWHNSWTDWHQGGSSSSWSSNPGPQGDAPRNGHHWHHKVSGGPRDSASHQGSSRQDSGSRSEVGAPWYIDVHDMVLEPPDHQLTVVLLHSCSGGPDDVLAYFHRLPAMRQKMRIVVPAAPVRKQDLNGWTLEQNSWFHYDDDSEDGNSIKDASQLEEQSDRILRLLSAEKDRLPGQDARRLVLWGLSQGVGLAVHVALRAPFTVGGIVALRGMALREDDATLRRDHLHEMLQIFAFNGGRDNMCPPDRAKVSYEALRRFGVHIQYGTDPWLAHACARGRQRLSQREFDEVAAFLQSVWGELIEGS